MRMPIPRPESVGLIQEHDRRLGRHLAVAVRTGTYCSYDPERDLPVAWDLAGHIVP